jgi:hypothetical protein
MNWHPITRNGKADQYAIRSACGSYTVCKVFMGGRVIFEGWHGKQHLGCEGDPEAAKRLCERHASPIPECDFMAKVEGGGR